MRATRCSPVPVSTRRSIGFSGGSKRRRA
jgi:hypothetical protein